jgi:hypothetical protein
MAPQSFSSLGGISCISLGLMLGCAGLLGIEDATCDVRFDQRCATVSIPMLTPIASGGSAMVPGAAGAGASTAGGGGSPSVAAAGNGSSTMEEDDEPESELPSLCERYCNTVAAACPEPNEQYASPGACRSVCEKLTPGKPGDSLVNTVECRLARAELARATGEPETYCFSAGPGGAGLCGSDCEGFCAVMTQTCTLMGSFDECLPQCALVPNLSDPPDNITYDISVQAGDSVQCRLFHVSAATLDPLTHCGHAAGSTPCATPPP